jgi:predicted metalloprotease with PDZ domain
MLKDFGIVVHLRPADNVDDAGGKAGSLETAPPPWLGMTAVSRDGREVVGVVHSDSPAELAGLAAGDELVALNDVRLTKANIDTRLREYHAGDRVTISVFRSDALLKFKVRLIDPPEDTCWLELDPEPSEEAKTNQRAWLSTPPAP